MKTKDSTINDIPSLSELLKLQPVEINNQKIKEKTLDKLGVKAGQGGSSMPRRRWRVVLIAAVIMVVGVPSAYAVSSLVADMREQGGWWHALPCEVARWWNDRTTASSVHDLPGAVLRCASLDGDSLAISAALS